MLELVEFQSTFTKKIDKYSEIKSDKSDIDLISNVEKMIDLKGSITSITLLTKN